jgi:GTPase SAR1 family protein
MNKENEIAKMCPNNKLSKIIVTLGHNEVGKTNLIQRYTKKKFNEAYKETIGNKLASR